MTQKLVLSSWQGQGTLHFQHRDCGVSPATCAADIIGNLPVGHEADYWCFFKHKVIFAFTLYQ